MTINTKTFATLVSEQIAAIQAKSSALIDFTVGSMLRALVETNAALGLWIQGLVVQLLATTRAATSSDSDLDSWMADYGLARLQAIAATGAVTFSRFTPTNQALIPFGSQVQTADGSQSYTVTADPTNPAYTVAGYVVAAGVASVTVPVAANTAAAAGNAAIGQVTVLSQAITYIDSVSNQAAFTGGADAESDAALRARFVVYVASLSRATRAALGFAITSAQPGAVYSITENQQYSGAADIGFFYVVADDGSGAPPASFITAVTNAIDAVRAITTRFAVYSPVIVPVSVSMTVSLATGYDPASTRALVTAALQTYINTLAIGQTLTYTRLAQVAYDASPGVTNVTGTLLNGGTADVTATAKQVIKSSGVVVS